MGIGATYLRIVLSRWRLLSAIVVACTLAAWGVSTFYLAARPKFQAAARLNITPTAEELGYATHFVRGSTFDGGGVLLGTYGEFAHTRPVVAPLVDHWMADQARAASKDLPTWIAANSQPNPLSPSRIWAILNYGEAPIVPLREQLIAALVKGTTIETVEGTYLLRLSVEWDDAASAAWFANALSDAIIARAVRESRSSGQQLAGSLEQRLDAKRAALAATLRQSRDLKSSIGVVDVDRQKQSLLEARLTEQAQLTTDRATLDSAKSQVAALRRQAGGKLSSAQSVLEQTLAVEAPRAAGLERSVAIRQARIGQLDRQIASLGGYEDRIKALDDQAAALQQEVTALTERVSFSQTDNLSNGPRIQLIERAVPPLTRSSPKVFLNTALGFVAGCALAACALLLLGPAIPREATVEVEVEAEVEPETRASADVHPIRPPAPAMGRPIVAGNTALARAPATVHHLFPHPLPAPVDGATYAAAELAAVIALVEPWLGALPTQGTIAVGALDDAQAAQWLAQIAYAMVRDRAPNLRVVDATRPDADRPGGGPAFLYLGATDRDALDRLPRDTYLLLAADGPVSDELPIAAHVVRFHG
ncbi:MAG: hypothetical protein PGN23_14005 [Sphingomonas adhaesiva]|uniref:hypothetical protein n=1 Tax=Sphingomonas adhaesiva TaxID=28212 RepID=UPI002FF445AE